MSNKKDILNNVKEKFLFDAISFISIIGVDEKENFDGSLNIYIKTNNLGTVEMDNLNLLSDRLSVDGVDVQVIKCDSKMIGESIEKNTDTISVYIE